jgi:hypothetical protein
MLAIIIPTELRNQAVNREFWVVDLDVKELILLSVLACLGLGLAWILLPLVTCSKSYRWDSLTS